MEGREPPLAMGAALRFLSQEVDALGIEVSKPLGMGTGKRPTLKAWAFLIEGHNLQRKTDLMPRYNPPPNWQQSPAG
jgi:hypothetical protein